MSKINRNGWKQLTMIVTILVGVATAHAMVIVPSILHQANKEVKEVVHEHAQRLHDGAISRTEFDMLLKRLNRIESILIDINNRKR